ncbi:MAG: insulinase family protein [Chitinophagales bacterium]|nr:insulinase family protein [Chitinophagales bacterium]
MNRQISPSITLPKKLSFSHVHKETLSNGLSVHIIEGTSQNIFQLNILFPAGRLYESKRMLAGICASAILKGTKKHTAAQLAESFDFHGATIKFQANMYTAQLSLFCLSEKLGLVMPLLIDVLQNAIFPLEELRKIKVKSKQKLAVQWEKNSYIASQYFNQAIFGENKPFGYLSRAQDIDKISQNDAINHYHKHYQLSANSVVIAAGKIGATEMKILQDNLGQLSLKDKVSPSCSFQTSAKTLIELERKNSLQSAIRVGMPFVNIHDTDFDDAQILNTILGGYFGSRLMSNIREEKGFTYGIYSFINPILNHSYFCISTEVGAQFKKDTLKEIEFEINRLHNERISDEELSMVKNYMVGQLMKSVDGPLSMIGTLKNFLIFDLDLEVINKQLSNIHAVKAVRLQELAQQYLDFNKMIKVTTG